MENGRFASLFLLLFAPEKKYNELHIGITAGNIRKALFFCRRGAMKPEKHFSSFAEVQRNKKSTFSPSLKSSGTRKALFSLR